MYTTVFGCLTLEVVSRPFSEQACPTDLGHIQILCVNGIAKGAGNQQKLVAYLEIGNSSRVFFWLESKP